MSGFISLSAERLSLNPDSCRGRKSGKHPGIWYEYTGACTGKVERDLVKPKQTSGTSLCVPERIS